MSYREAQANKILLTEVNRRWPNRSRASDGWIGDAAHASRNSDHNPWLKVNGVGVVRARDFTADGIDADWLAEYLRSLGKVGDPRLNGGGYIIWNRRIASERQNWTWRSYSGSNPHTQHLHLSLSRNQAGFDSAATWRIDAAPTPEPKDWLMALTDKQQADLYEKVGEIHDELFVSVPSELDDKGHETKGGSLRWRIGTLMTRTSDLVTGRRPEK